MRRPLPPARLYRARLYRAAAAAFALLIASLGVGATGLMLTEGLGFVDAILFASMILTGMGPTAPITSTPAKLFVAAYALFSGVVFLTFAAILLGPVLHRFLHRFHLELDEDER